MSEIVTINGNLTADPVTRTSRNGAVTSFTVASNRRRFDTASGQWGNAPAVFHRVVCFKRLAEHVSASLAKGDTVVVVGEFVDDSFTPEGATQPIRRIQLQASDVAISLRFTALVRHTDDTTDPQAAEVENPASPDREPAMT